MDDSRIKDIIYKRRNGEPIINDNEAVISCKNEQSRDIIDNIRLGSYDNYGNYIIIPDIKNELIAMPKLVLNTKNEGSSKEYELKGRIPIFGDIFFKLKVGTYEAVLTLTENVNREAGGYLEVYDEVVDTIPLGKDRLPDSIIFRNFHITNSGDDFGKREEPYTYSNILTRKVYLSLLSKELKDVSQFDEHEAFDKMVSTLKTGGEYGRRVLTEFVERLKDRPGIFEIEKNENYNKAVNEVLLSSLDIATTQQDKDNYETKQVYLKVLNARNENIQQWLKLANERVEEQFVNRIVNKATDEFNLGLNEGEESSDELYSKLAGKKQSEKKRTLDKPILKQGKESKKEQSKEDKIKAILDKKSSKKTPANKKLKASKGKTQTKKLKPKKKTVSKAKKSVKKKKAVKGKGKVKSKKKIKKAKAPAKAKAKVAALKPAAKPADKKKKKNSENIAIKLALVMRNKVENDYINISPSYSVNLHQSLQKQEIKQNKNATEEVGLGSRVVGSVLHQDQIKEKDNKLSQGKQERVGEIVNKMKNESNQQPNLDQSQNDSDLSKSANSEQANVSSQIKVEPNVNQTIISNAGNIFQNQSTQNDSLKQSQSVHTSSMPQQIATPNIPPVQVN